MQQTLFNQFIPTNLIFGCGSINRLATEQLPGKKALIVVSSGTSMRKYGYLDKVVSLLKKNGATAVVFDKILPNPIKSHV
ncbi:Long-chain-alcohol dehydrogenase 2, partial [termite gut metagenome]